MISYTPTTDSSLSQTLFSQRAHISSPPIDHPPYIAPKGDGEPLSKGMVKVLNRVGPKLEQNAITRFGENADKGKAGFTSVLDELARRIEEKRMGEAVPST